MNPSGCSPTPPVSSTRLSTGVGISSPQPSDALSILRRALAAEGDALAKANLSVMSDPPLHVAPTGVAFAIILRHSIAGLGRDAMPFLGSIPFETRVFFDSLGNAIGGVTTMIRPSGVQEGVYGDVESARRVAAELLVQIGVVLAENHALASSDQPLSMPAVQSLEDRA